MSIRNMSIIGKKTGFKGNNALVALLVALWVVPHTAMASEWLPHLIPIEGGFSSNIELTNRSKSAGWVSFYDRQGVLLRFIPLAGEESKTLEQKDSFFAGETNLQVEKSSDLIEVGVLYHSPALIEPHYIPAIGEMGTIHRFRLPDLEKFWVGLALVNVSEIKLSEEFNGSSVDLRFIGPGGVIFQEIRVTDNLAPREKLLYSLSKQELKHMEGTILEVRTSSPTVSLVIKNVGTRNGLVAMGRQLPLETYSDSFQFEIFKMLGEPRYQSLEFRQGRLTLKEGFSQESHGVRTITTSEEETARLWQRLRQSRATDLVVDQGIGPACDPGLVYRVTINESERVNAFQIASCTDRDNEPFLRTNDLVEGILTDARAMIESREDPKEF